MELLFDLCLVLLRVILLPFDYFIGKRYNKGLKTVCKSMGLIFSSNKLPAPEEELRKFNLFSAGIHPRFKTVMKGNRSPFNVAIFNYASDGSNLVFLFQSDQFNLPHFKLTPLHTRADINFDKFPLFTSQYHLACAEEEQVRKVFNTKVLSFFENQNHKFLSIEGMGTRLFFYKANMKIAPEDIREFYDEAYRIAQSFL